MEGEEIPWKDDEMDCVTEFGILNLLQGKKIEQSGLFNAYKNRFPGCLKEGKMLMKKWKKFERKENKDNLKNDNGGMTTSKKLVLYLYF